MLINALAARNVLITTTIVILVIGILAVGSSSSFYSMRQNKPDTEYLGKHIIRVLVGAFMGVAIYFSIKRLGEQFLKKSAFPIYIFSIVAIIATFIFSGTPYAPEINGSVRWLRFGFNFLPSDLMRLGFVLVAGFLISSGRLDIRRFRDVFFIALLAIAPSILTYFQPDLSGSAFTVFVMLVVLFVAGAKFSHLLIIIGALLLFGTGAILLKSDYQLDRIRSSIEHTSHEQDGNYQSRQAKITLGSGGFFGRGLGQSRQKRGFLPEAHTDFILAVIGEETGLFGTISVLLLFSILFSSSLWIARAANSSFSAIIGGGVTAILIAGVMIHTFVNTGIIPVTGMPLPLISWGGTAMIVNLSCIGIIAGISNRSVGVK